MEIHTSYIRICSELHTHTCSSHKVFAECICVCIVCIVNVFYVHIFQSICACIVCIVYMCMYGMYWPRQARIRNAYVYVFFCIVFVIFFNPYVHALYVLYVCARRSNEVPESVGGFSLSHTATAKISRLWQLYAVLVSIIFNFSPQTSFLTLMSKLHLHRTILISFVSLASFHVHCILGSTQQFRIR